MKTLLRLKRKNKTGGIVTNTVLGVGALIIVIIILFVIISNIIGADLFEGVRSSATRTQSLTLNDTVQNFGYPTYPDPSCSLTTMINASGGETILSGNYTVSGCTVVNATATYGGEDVNITSTTTYNGEEETAIDNQVNNFTTGINNISNKIPTILLIVAVVFLFGVIVLLVVQSKRMGIGGGESSSL